MKHGPCAPLRRSQRQGAPARLAPEKLGRIDWHNDLSKLILDINESVRAAGDERNRARLIRKLRRALEGEER